MPVPGVAAKAFLLKFAVLQHQIANAARINTGLNLAAQNLEAVRFVINGVQVAVNLPLSLLGTKFAVANIAAQALDAVRVLHNGKQIIAAGLAIPVFIGLKKFNKILKIKNGIDTLAFGAAALKRIALKVLDRILLIKNGAVVLASGLFVVHNLFKAALAEGIHLLTVLPGIVLSALGFGWCLHRCEPWWCSWCNRQHSWCFLGNHPRSPRRRSLHVHLQGSTQEVTNLPKT